MASSSACSSSAHCCASEATTMVMFIRIRNQPIKFLCTSSKDSMTYPQNTVTVTTAWPVESTMLCDSWRNGRSVVTTNRHTMAMKFDAIMRTMLTL